jgi:hypothetical protein
MQAHFFNKSDHDNEKKKKIRRFPLFFAQPMREQFFFWGSTYGL